MLRVLRLAPVMALLLTLIAPALLGADQELPGDLRNDYGRFTETDPPIWPVRPVAEFEPASHVLIRYPLGIPVSLVAQLADTAQLVCIVASASVQSQATSAFTNAGVNMANVSFLIAATDSYWTRDYGPWFIFDGNGDYGVVDFRYNRPRPNDDLIPQVFANQNGLDYYGMNLYQTGGNYMTDGINTAAQTTIAYSENPSLTQAQVNAKMHDYLGITSYHVLPDPNNTYIDHIDCWGKFLAPDKVLIRSVPSSHAQYNAIEQTAAYFANLNCTWGYPYRVYRVNTPQNQPYTNSLILNNKVFVPVMNSTYDAAALQVYQNALPGYQIIGVTGASSTPWESTDALHCRAHEIPDRQMLHITHQPLWGLLQPDADLGINATIRPHSGQPVYADSLYVRYRVNQGNWLTSPLAHVADFDYHTQLGGFAPGDTIWYYIHAADQSGRRINHPYPGALDPHHFTIFADTQAPQIDHTPINQILEEPTLFLTTVTDNVEVSQVTLLYRTNQEDVTSEALFEPFPEAGQNAWYLTLYPDFQPGDSEFYYQIEALDSASPANVAYHPAAGQWNLATISGVPVNDALTPSLAPARLSVFPNPFVPGASSHLAIEYKGAVNLPQQLKIFNTRGQEIYAERGVSSTSGEEKYLWKGTDMQGRLVSPGVYFLRLDAGDNCLLRKILVLN